MSRCLAIAALGSLLSVSVIYAGDTYDHVAIADCHVHLLDFLQNGDYFADGHFVRGSTESRPKPGERGQRIEALLQMMDHAGVSDALVCGMPFVKKWSAGDPLRPRYYLHSDSRVVRARDTDREIGHAIVEFGATPEGSERLRRIHPFICGFDATDLGAVDFITKLVKDYPGVWQGIGEVMSRHDDLTNLTTEEGPRANHPALFRVYDFAGEHGLPVSIHHNIAPVSSAEEFQQPLYLAEILEAFDEFPKTKFVWCHAGISRRIYVKDLPGILRGVLQKHRAHVSIDLSWVVYQDYVLKDLDAWRELVAEFPNNFLVGSDVVGSLRNYVSTIRAYDRLFSALKDETLVQRVAQKNFLDLIPRQGLTLSNEYKYPEDRYVPKSTRPMR